MKEFNKNEEGLVCEECKKTFKNKVELSKHINKFHSGVLNYIEKWIKEPIDGICKTCGEETKLSGYHYRDFCSRNCLIKHTTMMNGSPFSKKEIQEKSKQTMKEKYGNEHYTNPEKTKQTCLIKYGVDNGSKTKQTKEKISKTCFKNNGVKYPMQSNMIKEKSKKTCLQKYGVEFVQQNKTIKQKSKYTMIIKYGVEYSAQNKEILEKQQKARFFKKQFRDTNIWYQSSYELDFLEKYYDKYSDIQRGPRIKYELEGKTRYYFSDFYIPSKNIVIECKNSYLAKRDKNIIKEKENATINNGFDYIMIVNKDYSKFML